MKIKAAPIPRRAAVQEDFIASQRSRRRWYDPRELKLLEWQHGWWEEGKELELLGYDAYNEHSANPSLLIGSELADPIRAPCRTGRFVPRKAGGVVHAQ